MKLKTTTHPLTISHDLELDYVSALELGTVVDGRPDEEFVEIDQSCALVRRSARGPVIGFVVQEYSDYEIPSEVPLSLEHRFEVPVLGLRKANVVEIVISARATFGQQTTADVAFFDQAVNNQGRRSAEFGWRAALSTGNMKAHFGLGYTLWELGRFQEAYRHLRYYTELAPHNSWALCWFGKACVSLGLEGEARDAFERAIALEESGSFETDADELLRSLRH